jgi:hypothetical protein
VLLEMAQVLAGVSRQQAETAQVLARVSTQLAEMTRLAAATADRLEAHVRETRPAGGGAHG